MNYPVPDDFALWCSSDQVRRLVRVCTAITGDPEAADDLANETLLQAWLIRDRLTKPDGASAWLDAIARHVCRRWATQRDRRLLHELSLAPTAAASDGDPLADLLERDELVGLLDRALALLPPATRDALVARYVDELTPAEIGRRTSASADAVSMRLLRGRTRLRALLEDDLRDDPAAQVWASRHGPAWRSTQLRCALCGSAGLEVRRDRARVVVEWRCPRCSSEVSAGFRLDDPVHGPMLADVRRPSALIARTTAWSAAYWPVNGRGWVACTRCALNVQVEPYSRPGIRDAREARGWRAYCPRCEAEQTTSWCGIALTRPETLELRRRHPATHAIPTRDETVDGLPVVIIGFRDDVTGEGVDVWFSAEPDARLLAVASG